jgi:hypothetical protein
MAGMKVDKNTKILTVNGDATIASTEPSHVLKPKGKGAQVVGIASPAPPAPEAAVPAKPVDTKVEDCAKVEKEVFEKSKLKFN